MRVVFLTHIVNIKDDAIIFKHLIYIYIYNMNAAIVTIISVSNIVVTINVYNIMIRMMVMNQGLQRNAFWKPLST